MDVWILRVAFMVGWVAFNVWMTRRVRDAGPALRHPSLLIAGIWFVPFMGGVAVALHLRDHHAKAPMPLPPPGPSAPAQIDRPGHAPIELARFTLSAHGWPVFNWRALREQLDVIDDEHARGQALLACQRAWLLHLRDAMGPYATLQETDAAWVVSTLEPRSVAATADFVARTRQRVNRVLLPLAAPHPDVKSILLVFDNEDDYYHYTAAYDASEGESAFSGGMFIDAGCPHFVTRRDDLTRIEPVIAHELTHAALSHLALPLWLDEGIAVNTEHRLTGATRGEHTPHELQQMHLRFWGDEEIQQFWTGASFRRPDDGNKLSYDLARIIVEQLGKDWPTFSAFAADASRDDAGAAAAQQHFGMTLGDIASALLQRDPSPAWEPATRHA